MYVIMQPSTLEAGTKDLNLAFATMWQFSRTSTTSKSEIIDITFPGYSVGNTVTATSAHSESNVNANILYQYNFNQNDWVGTKLSNTHFAWNSLSTSS